MLQLVIIVIAFVGLAIASRLAWQNSGKEKRYIAQHRKIMETMSKLSDAASEQADPPRFKVEPLRPPRLDLSRLDDLTDPDMIRIEAPIGSAPEEQPAPEQSLDETARIERAIFPSELVFGEDELAREGAFDTTEALAPPATPTASFPAASSPSRRIYRTGGRSVPLSLLAVGAGAVAVLVGVGFFVLSGGTHSGVPTDATSPPATTSKSTSSSTSPRKSSSTSGHGKTKTGSTKRSQSTKVATPRVLTPVSSTAQTATFDVAGGVKTVVVAATAAPCWVADSASPNGPILWDQTLTPGSTYTIHSSSTSLWIRVGNSHDFAMRVNGIPAQFSSPPGPFDFELVGS